MRSLEIKIRKRRLQSHDEMDSELITDFKLTDETIDPVLPCSLNHFPKPLMETLRTWAAKL